MSYSSYFSTFQNTPELHTVRGARVPGSVGMQSYYLKKDVVQSAPQTEAQKKAEKAFNALMAGHDKTTNAFVNQLKGIYDSYGKYVEEYGKNAKPIIEALGGDIEQMQAGIGDFTKLLAEIKPTLMDGVVVDPTAARTREEYTGNVAAAHGHAREQQKRDMISQGMNPYANTGATRAGHLAEAAGKTDAANTAYSDWRRQYNEDMKAKQQGALGYASLEASKQGMHGNVMQARGMQLGAHGNLLQNQLGATKLKAEGTEGLLGHAESRRAEALALQQQAQENQRYQDDITQQLNAKRRAGGQDYRNW
jgi:hypothetical protein